VSGSGVEMSTAAPCAAKARAVAAPMPWLGDLKDLLS
jgi:hypothetical protein